jgi:L-fucose dehydrogenase
LDLGLKDRVILVTGGGAGIGEAVTRACLAEGATVVVISRRSENVKNFLAEMSSAKATCNIFEADLRRS